MKMNRINCLNKGFNPNTFFVGGRDFDSYKENAARNNAGRSIFAEQDKNLLRDEDNGKSKKSGKETKIDLVLANALDNVLDWLIEEKI